MTLIDGKAISEQIKQEIAAEVADIVAKGGKRPQRGMRVQVYINPLRKRCDGRRIAG